ncbi:MAG: hypothetical protein ACREU2_09225 [Steroidobacteraceae bacterium]
MTSFPSPLRRLALALVRLTARWLPPGRADWAAAMIAELHHADSDRAALAWATGCVIAVIKQRMDPMTTGNWKVSRWIIAPEMLLCFVPLTIGWLDSIGNVRSLIAFDNESRIRMAAVIAAVPPATARLHACFGIAALIVATLGPAGLIVAFRWVALNRPLRSRSLRAALIAGPILCGALLIAARLTTAALGGFDFWSGLVLGSALPALGAVHLAHLGGRGLDTVSPNPGTA